MTPKSRRLALWACLFALWPQAASADPDWSGMTGNPARWTMLVFEDELGKPDAEVWIRTASLEFAQGETERTVELYELTRTTHEDVDASVPFFEAYTSRYRARVTPYPRGPMVHVLSAAPEAELRVVRQERMSGESVVAQWKGAAAASPPNPFAARSSLLPFASDFWTENYQQNQYLIFPPSHFHAGEAEMLIYGEGAEHPVHSTLTFGEVQDFLREIGPGRGRNRIAIKAHLAKLRPAIRARASERIHAAEHPTGVESSFTAFEANWLLARIAHAGAGTPFRAALEAARGDPQRLQDFVRRWRRVLCAELHLDLQATEGLEGEVSEARARWDAALERARAAARGAELATLYPGVPDPISQHHGVNPEAGDRIGEQGRRTRSILDDD